MTVAPTKSRRRLCAAALAGTCALGVASGSSHAVGDDVDDKIKNSKSEIDDISKSLADADATLTETNVGHVAAPFAGMVSVSVAEGDEVAAGDTVATIEAMKMEASITTPVAGTVKRVALTHETQVEGGDLVIVIE